MINANHSSYFNHSKTNRYSNKNKDKIKVEKKETEKEKEKENRHPEHKTVLDVKQSDNNKVTNDKRKTKRIKRWKISKKKKVN